MSQPNTGPSDITIRCTEWPGLFTTMVARQHANSVAECKHETIFMHSIDLKIDQIDYELWLATLPA